MHSLKDLICDCDWMQSIRDCYILFSRAISESFRAFTAISPLETIYKRDDEIGTFNNDQPEFNFHVNIDQDDLNNYSILRLDYSEVLSRRLEAFMSGLESSQCSKHIF